MAIAYDCESMAMELQLQNYDYEYMTVDLWLWNYGYRTMTTNISLWIMAIHSYGAMSTHQ